jgi:OOP family OmpA-OmpF porin
MRMTFLGKVVVLLLLIGAIAGGWKLYSKKIAPSGVVKTAVVPRTANLPAVKVAAQYGTTTYVEPGDDAGCTNSPEIRFLGYAWNGQAALHLARGGAQSTSGSLMCKYGINMKWERQDDNSKLQEALVSFATELSNGEKQPSSGANFVTIMGDGAAAFIQPLNQSLRKIGPDYQAKIVGAIGYSRGEDKFMGPPAWKLDPNSARGGVVSGVLRDGDWNIVQKWLGDNGLRTNPDEKTYDPDALNWVAANDYVDAAEKYISGYSETRPVVRNGQRTGETKTITVQGVTTWTPADVTVAEKKGGLVSIVSTREYSSQMPCIVIGIDKWCRQNPQLVSNMLLATAQAAEQIQRNPAALRKAAEISAAIYNEPNAGPEYWEKYYKGVTQTDAQGLSVELGGSHVNNLPEEMFAFGLLPGSSDLVSTTYKVFGDIVVSQYPELIPSYPAPSQVIDTRYLRMLKSKLKVNQTVIAAARPTYRPSQKRYSVVGRRQWRFTFKPGSAEFTPQAVQMLEQLNRDLLVGSGLIVEIHGHTDSQGSSATSMPLSEKRATAVKSWLQRKAPLNYPVGRIRAYAHGDSQPLDPRHTQDAYAKNRRVEIVLRQAAY